MNPNEQAAPVEHCPPERGLPATAFDPRDSGSRADLLLRRRGPVRVEPRGGEVDRLHPSRAAGQPLPYSSRPASGAAPRLLFLRSDRRERDEPGVTPGSHSKEGRTVWVAVRVRRVRTLTDVRYVLRAYDSALLQDRVLGSRRLKRGESRDHQAQAGAKPRPRPSSKSDS